MAPFWLCNQSKAGDVQSNMSCSNLNQPALKPRGRFTGERLKVLRPEVYRRVVDLLAEPREQVPLDHICRLLHVSEHTVKAIEKSQSIPIAERKQRLLAKALRIADKAADRIEDTIDQAGCSQAAVVFGISTEKALLLAGEPTHHLQVTLDVRTSMKNCDKSKPASSRPVPSLSPLPASESELVLSAPAAGD